MSAHAKTAEEAEVVIVGAGAAGCLFAARLAQAGRSVLVLEAGPARGLVDLVSSQIHARRLKWAGPLVDQSQRPPGPPAFTQGHATGHGFGGAAAHHFGTWLRLREADLRTRSLYGRGLDWPIGYDDLRPHYDRIQSEMGIAGDADAEHGRPAGAAYPMRPHPLLAQARLLKRGFAALDLPVGPLPLAIVSEPYGGRPPCQYDGWCEAGCPIGALANPLVTHLPLAQRHGARFVSDATVTRVLTDRRGRATAVEYLQRGARRRADARVVILAASVIQNPRLLLNSASPSHPRGLANRSGLVGAYFTVDRVAPVFGLFDVSTDNHLGVSAGQLLHRGAYVDARRATAAFGAYQWQIAPSMKPNDLLGIANTRADLFGAPLQAFMQRAVRHLAAMVGFAGALPSRDNRIVLASKEGSDGMRLARLDYAVGPAERALHAHLVEEGLRVMRAAGAGEAWAASASGGHLIGGTVMGDDPSSSVCDSHGCTHDVRNLFVAGSGLFPGGSGSSPTFTLYALAERSARHLVEHWGEHAA